MTEQSYTREQVLKAFNDAANNLLARLEEDGWLPDEGVRDAINATVNIGAHYLDHPGASVEAAIEAADYDGATPADVIDWCLS
jgi:hypothetical protein